LSGVRSDAEGRSGDTRHHQPHAAPRKRMFEDFTDAARAAREADARRDSIFAQSVDAQKNKDDLMAKNSPKPSRRPRRSPSPTAPARLDLD